MSNPEGTNIQQSKNIFSKFGDWLSSHYLFLLAFNKCIAANIIKMILILIIFALSLTILIFSQKMSFDADITKSISQEFLDNFKTWYFLYFGKCNPNDKKIKLDAWQGTVNGCAKGKDDKYNVRILDKGETCKSSEITIDEIPSQNIFYFKGLSICGKTQNDEYFDLLFSTSIVPENENCPEGTKNCGYIDTIKNKLCLKNDSECPVSYIQIRDINSPPPPGITNLKVISSDKIKFYYSNNPYANSSEIPYIQNAFRIADTEICAVPCLYHSNIDLYTLDALKKDFSTNCILNDYSQNVTIDTLRYHELSSVNQYELYEENGIIDLIKSRNLTNYGFNIGKYKENTLKLYVRSHFGFNKTCLENSQSKFNREVLTEILATAGKMKVSSEWLMWISIGIMSLILTGESLVFECCSNLDITVENIISNVGSFYMFFYTFYYGITYDDPYEKDMLCSDFVSNSNYHVMIEKIQDNGIKLEICSFLLIFLLIFNFIFLVLLKHDKKKKTAVLMIVAVQIVA